MVYEVTLWLDFWENKILHIKRTTHYESIFMTDLTASALPFTIQVLFFKAIKVWLTGIQNRLEFLFGESNLYGDLLERKLEMLTIFWRKECWHFVCSIFHHLCDILQLLTLAIWTLYSLVGVGGNRYNEKQWTVNYGCCLDWLYMIAPVGAMEF